MPPAASAAETVSAGTRRTTNPRIVSVDALRGFVMFLMIFVNDIASAPGEIVPGWLKHYEGKSGMTVADVVFPAFLFIVGMSIPFAFNAREAKGESAWRILLHVMLRAIALICIGILMVHGAPDTGVMGWSGALWVVLMFLSVMMAFSSLSPSSGVTRSWRGWKFVGIGLRCVGFAALVWLALNHRDEKGGAIVRFSPFSVETSWYGILGLIGWAYLVGAVVHFLCRGHRTALLGAMVLLMSLYAADRTGLFQELWLGEVVGIGTTLGSQAAVTVAGILLGTVLLSADMRTTSARTNFALLFIGGTSAAALLLNGLYGINKIEATPSWCLWACAITAGAWLLFYYLCDVGNVELVSRPLALAGQNVLLAYLLSEMLPSVLSLLRLGGWYWRLSEGSLVFAVMRSAGCAVAILALTVLLNRLGFRLKL